MTHFFDSLGTFSACALLTFMALLGVYVAHRVWTVTLKGSPDSTRVIAAAAASLVPPAAAFVFVVLWWS